MKFEDKDNPTRRVIAVDVDGVLTNGEKFWDARPTVNERARDAVRKLYQNGNIIVIWTARAWELAPELVGWLIENCVPFHGIMMAKGGADVYVDDNSFCSFDALAALDNAAIRVKK